MLMKGDVLNIAANQNCQATLSDRLNQGQNQSFHLTLALGFGWPSLPLLFLINETLSLQFTTTVPKK